MQTKLILNFDLFHTVKTFLVGVFFTIVSSSYLTGQSNSYNIIPNSVALESQETYSVIQDKHGYIWCSYSRGIVRFDGQKTISFGISEGLNDPTVFKLVELKDKIWFHCYNGDIGYIKDLQIVLVKNISPQDYQINFFDVDSNKHLVISYFGNQAVGYEILDNDGDLIDKRTCSHCSMLVDTNLSSDVNFFINHQYKSLYLRYGQNEISLPQSFLPTFGNPVIITNKTKYFISKYSITEFNDQYQKNIELDHRVNYNFLSEDNGNVWVCTYNGIILLNGTIKDTSHLLKNYHVSSLLIDHENNLWVTTLNHGLLQLTQSYFKELPPEKNNTIDTLFTLTEKYPNNSILLSEISDSTSNYLKELNEYDALIDRSFSNSFFKRSSSFEKGVFPLLRSNHINTIMKRNVIYSESSKSKQYINLHNFHRILHTYQLSDTSSLYFNISGGHQFTYTKDDSIHVKQIHSYPIRSNTRYENHYYSAIKGTGIIKFDTNWNPLDTISTEDGLSSNYIKKMIWVNDTLFASSSRGFNIIPSHGDIIVMNQKQGVFQEEIDDFLYWDKQLFFKGDTGIQVLPTSLIRKLQTPDWKFQIESINNLNVNNKSFLHIPRGVRSLNIHFNVISFLQNHTQIVDYRIRELDESWKKTDSRNVQYVNIPPGNYNFDLKLGKKIRSFQIIIPPFFYETLWFIISSICLIVLLVLLSIYSWIRSKEKKLFFQLNHLQMQQLLITTRLNPHFIFNSLASFQSLIIQQETTKSLTFLSDFSGLMRKILDRSGESMTILNDEIDFLENYIKVENLRFDMDIQIHWNICQTCNKTELKIPSMILQPLVENSIQHGFRNFDQNGIIQISLEKITARLLKITLTDNGKGKSETLPKDEKTHSTQLIKERVKLFKKIHQENYSFDHIYLSDEQGNSLGYKTEMMLPYEN